MSMPNSTAESRVRGITLIEVLVTLVVLSLGLLGVAATQLSAMRDNQAALFRTQAVILAYDLLDRMRSNRAEAYALAWDDPAPAGSSRSARDLAEWRANISQVLREGTGAVRCEAVCTVEIRWVDARSSDDAPATLTILGAL